MEELVSYIMFHSRNIFARGMMLRMSVSVGDAGCGEGKVA